MQVISKDKPKGQSFGVLKKMKKAKRIEAQKEHMRRAENKRKNSENRKERVLENELLEKIAQVKILGFYKNMLRVLINGEEEKRALTFVRRNADLFENLNSIGEFEVKLFGESIQLRKLSNFSEMKESLIEDIKFENSK
ncbi:hypothetical protein [Cetobacterium sp. SF1]|uniref:hypothetical protein n=1 Tax=unclassified Cetobacterium TaxID=2630983 RepID=UPI003CF66490